MTANRSNPDSKHHSGTTLADVAYADLWGKYLAAVDRWGEIVGRLAPAPTDDEGRLSSEFVEWMMGYEAGWVTEVETSRTGQLRCLGNAIVPLQAAAAWAHLLGFDSTPREREREFATDAPDQRQPRSGEPWKRRARLEDGGDVPLIPTPTAWLGRRPGALRGDAARWHNPNRSRELSDFLAALRGGVNPTEN